MPSTMDEPCSSSKSIVNHFNLWYHNLWLLKRHFCRQHHRSDGEQNQLEISHTVFLNEKWRHQEKHQSKRNSHKTKQKNWFVIAIGCGWWQLLACATISNVGAIHRVAKRRRRIRRKTEREKPCWTNERNYENKNMMKEPEKQCLVYQAALCLLPFCSWSNHHERKHTEIANFDGNRRDINICSCCIALLTWWLWRWQWCCCCYLKLLFLWHCFRP